MNNPQARFVLIWKVLPVPVDKLVEVRDISDWLIRVNVNGQCLGGGNSGKGFDLSREVVGRWSKLGKANSSWRKGRKGC